MATDPEQSARDLWSAIEEVILCVMIDRIALPDYPMR